MEISVSKQAGRVDVTVLTLIGQLDGQTYQDLIHRAREQYAAGVRDILLELGGLAYISSAGLVAIHTVARPAVAKIKRAVAIVRSTRASAASAAWSRDPVVSAGGVMASDARAGGGQRAASEPTGILIK